jgi:hypothetical protein
MKRILLSLCFATVSMLVPLMAQTRNQSLTSSPRAARVINIAADVQQSAAEIRQVDISDTSGHKGALVLIYEPASGLYWWAWRATAPDDSSDVLDPFLAKLKIQIDGGHLYVFGCAGRLLEVREESGHASTLGDAQSKAVQDLSTRWADLHTGKWSGTQLADLTPSLGLDFLYLKDSEAAEPDATLRSVTRQGDRWIVTLDGPNGDAAAVTLDNSFHVVSAAKVPPGPK